MSFGGAVRVFKKDKAEEAGEQVRRHCAVMAEHEQELLDMILDEDVGAEEEEAEHQRLERQARVCGRDMDGTGHMHRTPVQENNDPMSTHVRNV